ncbi:unnamed protein product [Musa hybrid cultivar]
MALLLFSSILLSILQCGSAQPSPGYYLSSRFKPLPGFYHGYNTLWGPRHQTVSADQSSVAIWLDRSSGLPLLLLLPHSSCQSHVNPASAASITGSGFKSNRPFRSGYFAASIKLQPGDTAGVITAFYLSNNQVHPGFHDEVDIEFLGTTPGRPYKLQTNVYVKGSGDGRVIGREMKFHLWFDPAADFHHYAILWNPNEIIFFVDDIPIRRYPRRSDDTFPLRPMWVYGTIWDASSWATDNGKHRVDYRHQPFVARFTRFVVRGCSAYAPPGCRPVPSSPSGFGLSKQQLAAMAWAQRNYMVYDYCRDDRRDRSLTPECWA